MTWLVKNSTTDGNKTAVEMPSASHLMKSHLRTVYAWGTWDGAALEFEVSPDGGTTWLDPPNNSFSADGMINLEIRATQMRAVQSSSGGSTSISMRAI